MAAAALWASEPQGLTRIRLGDSVVKLGQHGVIDKSKFDNLYAARGGLPADLKDVLTAPSAEPILLTKENANFYVNLLWPLGLGNYMSSNAQSPINNQSPVQASVDDFASTGGWNLGKESSGGVYLNKSRIVELTPQQEALATKIAQNTYRPCCDNPTFFQGCNHGSALLGLLQLGAAQGLTEDELYREALAFNSFWFAQNYVQAALYLKAVEGEGMGQRRFKGRDGQNLFQRQRQSLDTGGGRENPESAEAERRRRALQHLSRRWRPRTAARL